MKITTFNQPLANSYAFNLAFDWIISAEGGESNRQNDRGGHTKFGISKRAFPHVDIANLTLERARLIYWQHFWQANHCEQLSTVVAITLFDAAVNHGSYHAVVMLQNAVGAKPDGVFGSKTIAAVKAANQLELLRFYLARRARRYARICMKDPTQAANLLGWNNRIFTLQQQMLLLAWSSAGASWSR